MEPTGTAPQAWLAEALGKQLAGNFPGALLTYRRILSRVPEHPDVWCNLGLVLRELGQHESALEACAKALDLAPDNPIAHCNLGNLLLDGKDAQGALDQYRQALALDPANVPALANLSAALTHLGRLQEALEADERALLLEPLRADLHLNRGYTLMRSGLLQEAEGAFQQALALEPGLPRARWNLAYVRLLQGRYLEAWPDFEARLAIPEACENLRAYPQPRWQGEPFPGRTLLVWVEQGMGDTVQFARYLPQVQALGGRVVFQLYHGLHGLLASCPGADQVVAGEEDLPPFDLQVPLLDLPALFRSRLEDLPNRVPYLACPPDYVPGPDLADRLALDPERRKVALVWAGNPKHADDARRSLDPALLAPLAALPGIQWLSLQMAPAALPPLPGLLDLGDALRDFRDTAFVLERCDLVISVDTAVAHLAGAMGLPVLLLLPFFPDWRWLMRGEDCAWYPTMRIYRQPAPGAWPAVVARLLEDLQ
jgi:tetratricopeptide (TPR) repeat protein